jgi:hypothetical protein
MNFIPAIDLVGEPTPCKAGTWPSSTASCCCPKPRPPAGPAGRGRRWQRHAEVRHYLGRLDGLDCWALRLPEVPAGWRRCRCARR